MIIPVYNTGKDLIRALDSVLVQEENFSDYEVVAVDDGSDDKETLHILSSYDNRYKNLRVIHQKNSGGVAARRRGIAESAGRYITFFDSDDEVTPDYMQTLHAMVQEEADLYVFNNYLVRNGQPFLEKHDCPQGGDNHSEYVLRKLFQIKMDAVWDKIYLREAFLPVKEKLPKAIMFGDDIYMNMKYIVSRKIHRALVMEKPIYYHYIGTESSVSLRKADINRISDTNICLAALEEAARHYPELNFLENGKDFCYGYMVRHLRNIIHQGDGAVLRSNAECDFSSVEVAKAASVKGFCYRLALKYGCYKWG